MTKMRNNLNSKVPTVLAIAGSDNCAGAGIQADIKTCSALGVYCLTTITAVTAQNSKGVKSLKYVGDDLLRDQLETTIDAICPDAVKIGMIPNKEAILIISDFLKEYDLSNVVCDPILSATSGSHLCEGTDEYMETLVNSLFPLTDLITPNLPEIKSLLGSDADPTISDLSAFMRAYDINAILLKGGHAECDECTDTLVKAGSDIIQTFSSLRINTGNTHGTGCTLSSGIACGLAKGLSLVESIDYSRSFLIESMKRAVESNLFAVNGPLYHFDF